MYTVSTSIEGKVKYLLFELVPVWPEKNCQKSIKVAPKDFTRKNKDFDTFTKIA